ncbi:putative trans-sialidase [Trypanosoma cruzi]|nr:putative trans-sialidase [Trypanosoma cruzi]
MTSSCTICGTARLSVQNMVTHTRLAQPGVLIVGEGVARGCCNGATVFLTGASRAGNTNAGTQDGAVPSATASLQTPRAANPTANHGRIRFIHCGNAPSLRVRTATVWECPACTTARMGQNNCHFGTDGPCATNSVLSKQTKKRGKRIYCFVMNIGCASRGPTIHVVCGDLSFLIVTLLLCCRVRCTSSCACAHPP